MNLSQDLQNFKKEHCTTLCFDIATKEYYIKLPVSNYEELSIVTTHILSVIRLIADDIELSHNISKIHEIGTLIKILKALNLHEECLGLTELYKM